MDKLFDAVLTHSWGFNIDLMTKMLPRENAHAHNGPHTFVSYMNDQNIHYRHKLVEEVINKGFAVRGGPWRLFNKLPAIHEPTQVLTPQAFDK